MPTIAEIRQQYPQYQDLSDEQLANGLHQKFYSDMSFDDFSKKIGYSAPTLEEQNKADGLPADFPRHTPTESTGDWWMKELKAMTYPKAWWRQSELASRAAVDAVEGLPMTAMDMGVSARNMLTGSNYDLPSQMNRESLNTVWPVPRTPQEKIANFVESVVAGSKLPVPEAAKQAPAGFVKPDYNAVKLATLANSQKAGYVVPPSTTNPSIMNKLVESFGGKTATAQDAAVQNQAVTNTLAKQALGLNEDAPLTIDALKAVRSEAGKAYETLRNVGSVPLDQATSTTLDSVAAKFTGSRLKEALGGGNDIPKIVQALKDEPLDGSTAVDAIAMLRNKADGAYRAGESEIGKGYKAISQAIEGLMEKQLSGNELDAFKAARTLIAKTHTVEGAFNPSSGNVVATKLATQLAKKPLTDELRTAAQFGQAFPKAAQDIVDSGSVNNLSSLISSGAALATKNPWYLGWPFLRQAARSFLLSGAGQANSIPSATTGLPPELAMGLISGTNSLRKQ